MVDQDEKKPSEGIIDENLRRVYNETVEEGIPDRFKDLLDQLREQDSGKGSEG
ncbi:regulator [Sulfitobacter albidus]|uniref:Regulator n=1 Tax=Sulfitobacter albidus TaxID=2829501 RepID=A0A975JCH6_9RHOB|nr:NepR family anti-sigma factor [Sulfitobacter albidus]QUJ75954.1 regulator [Sulfitobacter albidus]